MRPFRFGVLAESARTGAELLETARRAEAAGYSTLLIRDHLVEGPFAPQLGPLTALATVAAATTTLRVGTLVLAIDFRHPAVLAKEVATLDVLSGGRVELGLGAGFLRSEYDQAGLRFDPPGERVGRLEEALQLLKALLGPGPVFHRGRHYTVEGLETFPRPVQRPHPPILVAGARPRMLAIAGRHADIVGIQTVSTGAGVMTFDLDGYSPATLAGHVDRVRRAAGDRFAGVELSTTATVAVTDRPREAAEAVARQRGWDGLAPERVLDMPAFFAGPVDEVVERFHERRATFGLTYFVVSDQALDAVGPVIARL